MRWNGPLAANGGGAVVAAVADDEAVLACKTKMKPGLTNQLRYHEMIEGYLKIFCSPFFQPRANQSAHDLEVTMEEIDG